MANSSAPALVGRLAAWRARLGGRHRTVAGALGFAVLVVFLLTRNIGIHIDENNYLTWAATNPLGDAETGKPYLFFLINFSLYKTVGALFGPFRPLFLYLFHIAATVLAGVWLADKLFPDDRGKFVALFAVLLLSPYVVFSATQLMMETPLVPVLWLVFGLLLDLVEKGPTPARHLAFMLAIIFAILLKDTALPAVGVLVLAHTPKLRRNVWSAAVAMVVGFAVNRLMLLAIDVEPHTHTGKASNLYDLGHISRRLEALPGLLESWAFFTGPVALVSAAVLWLTQGLHRSPPSRSFTSGLIVVLSLASSIVMGVMSRFDFARYIYPTIAIGLVAVSYLVVRRGPRWLPLAVAATFLFPLGSMWSRDDDRMALWPDMVTTEAHYSGFTVLPGVAVHGWVATSGAKRDALCVFNPRSAAEKPWAVTQFLRYACGKVRVFDERRIDAFNACSDSKAVTRRQYQLVPAQCEDACPANSAVDRCETQLMKGWATFEGRLLTNRTCLP